MTGVAGAVDDRAGTIHADPGCRHRADGDPLLRPNVLLATEAAQLAYSVARLCPWCGVPGALAATLSVARASGECPVGTVTRSLRPGAPSLYRRQIVTASWAAGNGWELRHAHLNRVPYILGPIPDATVRLCAALGGFDLDRWEDLPPASGRVASGLYWHELDRHLCRNGGRSAGFAARAARIAAEAIAAPAGMHTVPLGR